MSDVFAFTPTELLYHDPIIPWKVEGKGKWKGKDDENGKELYDILLALTPCNANRYLTTYVTIHFNRKRLETHLLSLRHTSINC